MKKLLLLSALAVVAFASCKKRVGTVSEAVTASYPTVTIKSGQYFSFPVGGGPLPDANNIIATAYDSFYNQELPVVVDASTLSNLKPGLYVATVSAKNKYGYIGYAHVYVAITSVADTFDISGRYYAQKSPGVADTFKPAYITKLAAGMFRTSNVLGADTGKQKLNVMPAVFALSDYNTVDFGSQRIPGTTLSASGMVSSMNGLLDVTPPDTTLTYMPFFNGIASQNVTFLKQ